MLDGKLKFVLGSKTIEKLLIYNPHIFGKSSDPPKHRQIITVWLHPPRRMIVAMKKIQLRMRITKLMKLKALRKKK